MVLAINVQVQQDKELRLITIPLLTLTGLLFQWWVVNQIITGWRLKIGDIAAAAVELMEAFGMASLVFWNMFEIVGKSLWYGMIPTWAN
jgi:hypothetical protein